jgi:glycosyltransferase involved in cell wall biosynthesis
VLAGAQNGAMDRPQARLWLLSAYRADSHAAWADGLVAGLPEFDWQRFELPGRNFAWRIRGNPLSWLDTLADGPAPDGIVATSMVDLATIRGLHPRIGRVPTLLYFHENQFAYPISDAQTTSVEAQIVQLYAALAADRVLFNSDYNRSSFLAGVAALLARLPEPMPDGVVERLSAKSGVLPVPIDPIPTSPAGTARDPRLIVWNHRWDYDKAPERFAAAMLDLAERGVAFRLALLGARPRKTPAPLTQLREALADRIIADGRLPRAEYRALLARSGIAVSTARHEFQGLGMLEAASAGCTPLVPDALVYPEIFAAAYRYPDGNIGALIERLQHWLEHDVPAAPDMSAFGRNALESQWREALNAFGCGGAV